MPFTTVSTSADAKNSAAQDQRVRVMIVDDSAVVRGLLSRWLEDDQRVHVVAAARNGKHALEELPKVDPDVVLLDVEMPEMDGLTALPLLLKAKLGLVVIMASTLTRRNAEISLKALHLGARDYVPKPESSAGMSGADDFKREIVEKVTVLGARARDRRLSRSGGAPAAARPAQPVAAAAARTPAATGAVKLRPFSRMSPKVLAIGSSTGGPQALMEVLRQMKPVIMRVPVLITQHMPSTFTAILAEHLAKATGVPAREAVDGEAVLPGSIYVAPGGRHMVVQRHGEGVVIALNDSPPINFCKPAVDPMFDSVAKAYGASTLAVVLTGMGADGARGAVTIADAGGSILVQDEATSVVWRMPGATYAAGAAAAVLPLADIAPKIAQLSIGAR